MVWVLLANKGAVSRRVNLTVVRAILWLRLLVKVLNDIQQMPHAVQSEQGAVRALFASLDHKYPSRVQMICAHCHIAQRVTMQIAVRQGAIVALLRLVRLQRRLMKE